MVREAVLLKATLSEENGNRRTATDLARTINVDAEVAAA